MRTPEQLKAIISREVRSWETDEVVRILLARPDAAADRVRRTCGILTLRGVVMGAIEEWKNIANEDANL